MDNGLVTLLQDELARLNIFASPAGQEAVLAHLSAVREWNERVNLTAITEPREMVIKHAIDSAALMNVVDLAQGVTLLDVGSGAGFPGVTVKCLRPDIRLVLLESLAKRCRFLEAVGTEVVSRVASDANGYRVVWGRAEEFAQKPEYRERFHLVVARAVAELRVLTEYCLPFCEVGGSFVAMKGPGLGAELKDAERAIEVLGGHVAQVQQIELPFQVGERTFVRINKVRETPRAYPRKPGTPAKAPL